MYKLDAADLIARVLPSLPQNSLVYLDPPYYENADRLYKNHYKHDDHLAIADLVVNKITLPWIVSYDNTPEIRKLYTGVSTIKYGMTYSAQEYYKGSEVMFFSPNLTVPNVKDPSKLKAA
jgi:DNA adenine methylase